ncbi:MAG: ABC transporter ATP-binding protein [Nanoarchaeota archaeon]
MPQKLVSGSEDSTLISLDDVWKVYHMGEVDVPALQGITLKIRRGEFVTITGPSGSGKSTMMNVVGALDIPSKGAVFLKHKNIADMPESDLAQLRGETIGFIFQQFNLLPTFSALDNVKIPLELQNFDDTEAEKRAMKILESVGLGDRLHHYPSQLSGGQQQRVAIARALAANPDVVLADEPTGNLDSKTGEFIMNLLGELHQKEGKTIIMVTHDLHLVQYADRVVHIKDGKIEKEQHKSHIHKEVKK